MSDLPLVFFELIIVVAFVLGWLILEWQGRRLDRQMERQRRDEQDQADKGSERTEGS